MKYPRLLFLLVFLATATPAFAQIGYYKNFNPAAPSAAPQAGDNSPDLQARAAYALSLGAGGGGSGGAITAPLGTGTTPANAVSIILIRPPQGGIFTPTASTNGTELANRPAATSGGIFTIPAGGSVTIFKAPTGQTFGSPPAAGTYKTYSNTGTAAIEQPVYLAGTDAVYVTAISSGTQWEYVIR